MKIIPKVKNMDKYYAQLVDEALFECDLDLDASAKVVEVNDCDTGVLCTIQCVILPNDGQLKLLLDELRMETGTEGEIAALDNKTGRILIKILKN